MRALLLSLVVVLVAACGDDALVYQDAQPVDAGIDGSGQDCFTNPQTHTEIINACTTAEKIVKRPALPLLLPDGGLPPLP